MSSPWGFATVLCPRAALLAQVPALGGAATSKPLCLCGAAWLPPWQVAPTLLPAPKATRAGRAEPPESCSPAPAVLWLCKPPHFFFSIKNPFLAVVMLRDS